MANKWIAVWIAALVIDVIAGNLTRPIDDSGYPEMPWGAITETSPPADAIAERMKLDGNNVDIVTETTPMGEYNNVE